MNNKVETNTVLSCSVSYKRLKNDVGNGDLALYNFRLFLAQLDDL